MNVSLLSKSDSSFWESQAKISSSHLNTFEENVNNITSSFGCYLRRIAKLRDGGDQLASELHKYAEKETINISLKTKLEEFSEVLATLGDHCDIRVNQLDLQVVKSLSQYEFLCRNAKSELKQYSSVREKESTRRKSLIKLNEKNTQDRQKLAKAEAEVVKAVSESSQAQKQMIEYLETFELKKLQDLKNILKDFVEIEMRYHLKAVELLTEGYHSVDQISEEKDLRGGSETTRSSSRDVQSEIDTHDSD